jgi:hypothetical protein
MIISARGQAAFIFQRDGDDELLPSTQPAHLLGTTGKKS